MSTPNFFKAKYTELCYHDEVKAIAEVAGDAFEGALDGLGALGLDVAVGLLGQHPADRHVAPRPKHRGNALSALGGRRPDGLSLVPPVRLIVQPLEQELRLVTFAVKVVAQDAVALGEQSCADTHNIK